MWTSARMTLARNFPTYCRRAAIVLPIDCPRARTSRRSPNTATAESNCLATRPPTTPSPTERRCCWTTSRVWPTSANFKPWCATYRFRTLPTFATASTSRHSAWTRLSPSTAPPACKSSRSIYRSKQIFSSPGERRGRKRPKYRIVESISRGNLLLPVSHSHAPKGEHGYADQREEVDDPEVHRPEAKGKRRYGSRAA